MDGVIRNRANNAPPLAGAVPQFLPDHHRSLAKMLYRVGLVTSVTAAGGLVDRLVPASARSQQAEDVPGPLSQATLFFLFVTLFGGLSTLYVSTLYVGRRVEEATPRWRKVGVAICFLCFLLLIAAVSLVGSRYYELALNFIDD